MVISASLQACGVVFPFAMLTSICRSIVTICSGLYLLMGITRFSSKWILSHSTWYNFRRSRHSVGKAFPPVPFTLGDRDSSHWIHAVVDTLTFGKREHRRKRHLNVCVRSVRQFPSCSRLRFCSLGFRRLRF